MWDPATYLRFRDQRRRPFGELLNRIGATAPREVIDLGCGPGTLTVDLAERWPKARVIGLDSSAEMMARAEQTLSETGAAVTFGVADVRAWRPGPETDVVISNAVLHWIPEHDELLIRWVAELPARAWMAFQVPGNADAPSHHLMREAAADPRWADRLREASVPRPVHDADGYARLLLDAGYTVVDAWETLYVHVLPVTGPTHPVLEFMEGSVLRPVRAALDDEDWAAYRELLGRRLAEAYPAVGDVVPQRFRRVFAVARTRD